MAGTFDVRVVMDSRALLDYAKGRDGDVFRYMSQQGEKVKLEAQRRVGVGHNPPEGPARARQPGTLRDSIVKRFVQRGDGIVVQVGSEDPVALWHHEGTEPHVILPVKGPRLVFWSERAQRVIFAERVNHPGTQPNRFLLDALSVLD